MTIIYSNPSHVADERGLADSTRSGRLGHAPIRSRQNPLTRRATRPVLGHPNQVGTEDRQVLSQPAAPRLRPGSDPFARRPPRRTLNECKCVPVLVVCRSWWVGQLSRNGL